MMSYFHSKEVYVTKPEARTGKGVHLIRNVSFFFFCLMPATVPVLVLFNCALLVTVVPKISEEGKLYKTSDILWTISYPCVVTAFGCMVFFMYKGASVA